MLQRRMAQRREGGGSRINLTPPNKTSPESNSVSATGAGKGGGSSAVTPAWARSCCRQAGAEAGTQGGERVGKRSSCVRVRVCVCIEQRKVDRQRRRERGQAGHALLVDFRQWRRRGRAWMVAAASGGLP